MGSYSSGIQSAISTGAAFAGKAREKEVFEQGRPLRELKSEQAVLETQVLKAGDDVYGGRVARANELAKQAKYIKDLNIQTIQSQNSYRNAQAAKMSASAFDTNSDLYSLDGNRQHLSKMAESAGGSPAGDAGGYFQMGPNKYKPVIESELTAPQTEQWKGVTDKWDDMIETGEIEVVETEGGQKYKIRESGQMFDPTVMLLRGDGSVTSALDPGVALGTGKRKANHLKQTQPKIYKDLEPDASDAASPILKKHGLRVTSGFRSQEHNRSVGGAKQSKHMEGHAMDVHWKDKSVAEKAEIIKDFKQQGFTGFGIGNNTLHIDRRGKPASWSYIGGTSTGGGKMPNWAAEAINSDAELPEGQTTVMPKPKVTPVIHPTQASVSTQAPKSPSVWTDSPMDDTDFNEQATKSLGVINAAIREKAATSEQKEFGVLLSSDAEWAQQHGISTVEQYAQYKDIMKERNKEFVKDQKADNAIQRVSSYEDYINDTQISFMDKTERLTDTSTQDLNRLTKDAKDAGVYNPEVIKETSKAIRGIDQSAPAMMDIATLYSKADVTTEYVNAWSYVKQKMGEYSTDEDPRKRAAELLTVMAKSAKGRATAILLKTMSGTAASDQEYARTLLYSFGAEGVSKLTTLATIQQGLKVSQKELEGHVSSSVSNGGYKIARDAARLHKKISGFVADESFTKVTRAVAPLLEEPKGAVVPQKDNRKQELQALKVRAEQAGRTMNEQAKAEGFK